jgi:hypothetical protein
MPNPLNVIKVAPNFDEYGRASYSLNSYPKDSGMEYQCLVYPERFIPVVFLPGVMGSNLKTQGTKDKLWRLDSAGSALSWLNKGAERRRTLLDPAKVVVDPDGLVNDDLVDPGFISRRKRGWGEAGYLSYGEFLPWLQYALDDFDKYGVGQRSQLIGMSLKQEKGDAPLEESEVKLSYKYRFPLHVMGYNWLDSIDISANNLLKRITGIIEDYRSRNIKCEKVILVTHSMGGVVARYCSELAGGKNNILGIVHGVLPAIGAASAYQRMKAGMESSGVKEWIAAQVPGGSGAEMTAVLSQSPGPLQLLPGVEYGMNWLKIQDGDQIYSLPKTNPYTDIYTVRGKWWSLCEDKLINPANNDFDKTKLDNDWDNYENIINLKVAPLIEGLKGHYHSHTYSFYGGGIPTYSDLVWQSDTPMIDSWLNRDRKRQTLDSRLIKTSNSQIYTTRTVSTPLEGEGWTRGIYQKYSIVPPGPSELGDGTVPLRSSKIPEHYLHSRLRLNVAHESAYKNEDAQRYTLWAIVKIAQNIQQTSLRYNDE